MHPPSGEQVEGTPRGGFGVRSQDGLAVITPPREIDAGNAARLEQVLAAAVADHPVVVVDMSANTFCDSSGIRALVLATQQARGSERELRVVMGGPSVRRVFKLTGVDRMLAMFETLAAATGVTS
jgi:anti-anti-sigma factor